MISNRGDLVPPNVGCVVYDRVPTSRYWDFVAYPNGNRRAKNPRPVRWIVLRDEKKLYEDGALDFLNVVFALHWTYGFSIPFPMGCTAVPNELQLSKKYADI